MKGVHSLDAHDVARARRILVKGGSGAGKSTLARLLAHRFDLAYLELDALHHGPDWVPVPEAQFRQLVQASLDDERGWVIDGNYDSKLGRMLLERAELTLWLDLPLATKLARLARRTAARVLRQEVLWNGNRESLRTAFWGGEALFVWAVRTHFAHRRSWPDAFRDLRVVRLRTETEVAAWLEAAIIGIGAA